MPPAVCHYRGVREPPAGDQTSKPICLGVPRNFHYATKLPQRQGAERNSTYDKGKIILIIIHTRYPLDWCKAFATFWYSILLSAKRGRDR